MIYTLDTNVLVDAVRRPVDLEQLKQFLNWAGSGSRRHLLG